MSIYSEYQECINTFIHLDKIEWNFKSNPKYNYMLEHVWEQLGKDCLSEIINRFYLFFTKNKNYLIELCNINDLYGEPNKAIFNDFTTCSPTNIRYILHSLLILTHMNECLLKDVDLIEIGGGYGGLCFFLNKLSIFFNINIKSYTIFDLHEPLLLQEKYLDGLNISNVNFAQINNFKNIKENSFFVSTYAFSEIEIELQKEYTQKILNPYVSHGFIAWNSIDLYDFIENKNISSEIDFPVSGPKNLYVKF